MKPYHTLLVLTLVLSVLASSTIFAGNQNRGGNGDCDRDRVQDRTHCQSDTVCNRLYGNGPCTNCVCTNATLNARLKIRNRHRTRIKVQGSLCLSNCWQNPVRSRLSLRLGSETVCSNLPAVRVRKRTAVCKDPETGSRIKTRTGTNGVVQLRFRYRTTRREANGELNGSNFMYRVQCRYGTWEAEGEANGDRPGQNKQGGVR